MEDDDEGLDEDQQCHDGREDGQRRVGSGPVEALDAVLGPHVKDLDFLQAGQDSRQGGEQAGAAEEAVHRVEGGLALWGPPRHQVRPEACTKTRLCSLKELGIRCLS